MGNQREEAASFSQERWDRSAFRAWSEQSFLSPVEENGCQIACRLAQALDAVIQEELSPQQRRILERYWFEGEKITQIAYDLGQNRATVSRTLRRAQAKIYDHLKYAVLALHSGAQEQDLSQAVSRAAQVLSARGQPECTMGERIRKLRMRHALAPEQLAAALSVDEAAVSRWERDVEFPDTPALMRMARLFGVRADDILFGGEGGGDCPGPPL